MLLLVNYELLNKYVNIFGTLRILPLKFVKFLSFIFKKVFNILHPVPFYANQLRHTCQAGVYDAIHICHIGD